MTEDDHRKIIGMPHHVSKRHIPMSSRNRAAQFAPFAALSGFEDKINDAAHVTDSRKELWEDRAAELDEKTRILIENAERMPQVTIEYFVPYSGKNGGEYRRIRGEFRSFEPFPPALVLRDGKKIPLSDIYSIEGDIFG